MQADPFKLRLGSYGAVYYPCRYLCSKPKHSLCRSYSSEANNKEWVCKYTQRDDISQQEYTIGSLIRCISDWDQYYIPVENYTCTSPIVLTESSIDDLKIDQPIIFYMRYGGNTLYEHLADAASEVYINSLIDTLIIICEGLVKLHQAGIIHADIQLKNIVAHNLSDRPKLIDFGIAFRPECNEELADFLINKEPVPCIPPFVNIVREAMDYGKFKKWYSWIYKSIGISNNQLTDLYIKLRKDIFDQAYNRYVANYVKPKIHLIDAFALGYCLIVFMDNNKKTIDQRLIESTLMLIHPDPDKQWTVTDYLMFLNSYK